MDLVTGALRSVIFKLALLLKEYSLPTRLRKKITRLSRDLEGMHAALCKVAEVPPEQLDERVKLWARDVRELSYDVEDILDKVRVEAPDPSRRQRARMKMRFLFREAKTQRDIASAVDIVAGTVKHISEILEEVVERHGRYSVDDIVAMPSAMVPAIDPRVAAMYNEERQLVGIEGPMNELISILLRQGDQASSKETEIISIVGFGGSGKTTLAKAVYDKLIQQFDCGAFVSIGRKPDLQKVFQNLLFQLDKKYQNSQITILHERELNNEIQELVKGKRYLVVIDDIWEQSSWKSIKSALVGNNNGSRIIATTRHMDVTREAGGLFHMLKPLSLEDSRKLFYTRIFGGEGVSIDNQLEEASDTILKKCAGVPLAIITMASLLASKPRGEWLEVLNTFDLGHKENRQVENTMKILSFSYYALPLHLRACLLYLSALPEDYIIKKNTLIWKWIGEGFTQKEPGKCLFDIGEEYFNSLVNRSLIGETNIGYDGVIQGCRVHDLVLDFIRSMSSEENFVFGLDEDDHKRPLGKVRWLALNHIKEELCLEDSVGLAELRSVNAIGCPGYIIRHLNLNFLRVLALESCGSQEAYDLEHLGKLLQLRFLGLRNTLVGKLPEEMGRLKFLQTLMLEGSGVEELPESMGLLTQLLCLNADWKTRVPSWIGKLTSLQQLEMYPGGGDDDSSTSWFVKELGKLTQLRVLRFMIKVQDEGQIRQLLESLSNLHDVRDIHFGYYGAQLNNAAVLEPAGFVLSAQLRFMEMRWMEFSRLPVWINPHDLPNLRHLWLMLSDVDKQDWETLGKFPWLSCLHLVLVNTGRGGIITLDGDTFQKLESCSITKPLKFQKGAMPRLVVLDFHFNMRLLSDVEHDFDFDFGLVNLMSLQQVIIECHSSAAFPEEVERADATLRQAIDSHPNRPTIEISWF